MFKLPEQAVLLFEEMERTESFQPFLDLAANDVEFSATIRAGTPISGVFRGKEALSHYFNSILTGVATFRQLQPQEFVISKDRVVVLGDDEFTLVKNQERYHSPYAMVIELENGLIKKALIIQDLSGIYDAYVAEK